MKGWSSEGPVCLLCGPYRSNSLVGWKHLSSIDAAVFGDKDGLRGQGSSDKHGTRFSSNSNRMGVLLVEECDPVVRDDME